MPLHPDAERGMEATRSYASCALELLRAVSARSDDDVAVIEAGKRYALARESLREACDAYEASCESRGKESDLERKEELRQLLKEKRKQLKVLVDELRALDAQLVAWDGSETCTDLPR